MAKHRFKEHTDSMSQWEEWQDHLHVPGILYGAFHLQRERGLGLVGNSLHTGGRFGWWSGKKDRCSLQCFLAQHGRVSLDAMEHS